MNVVRSIFVAWREKKNNFVQKLSDNKNLLKMACLTRIKLQTKAYDEKRCD